MKSESSECESQAGHLFPLRCKPYQCLHCIGETALPLHERLRNLGSKIFVAVAFCPPSSFSVWQTMSFPHSWMRSNYARQRDAIFIRIMQRRSTGSTCLGRVSLLCLGVSIQLSLHLASPTALVDCNCWKCWKQGTVLLPLWLVISALIRR